jgi:diaminopimelate epimerase
MTQPDARAGTGCGAGEGSRVPYAKYHGTGNDFVVVAAAAPIPDHAAFAAAHSDRETGVDAGERRGADGLLVLDPDAEAEPTRVEMRLVQPDGSEAAMCGNGARCAAAWAAARTGAEGERFVENGNRFVLDTGAGPRETVVEAGRGGDGDGAVVTVGMGVPRFSPAAVPLAGDEPLVASDVAGLTVTAVNAGVPHAVAFDEKPDALDDLDVAAVAEPVRHADAFPEGANVTFAAAEGDGFRQRTFERGVEAETRSCGTGAVAVAAAARRLGLLGRGRDRVRVRPPGGELTVRLPADGPAELTGPVRRTGGGELPADPG